MIIKQDISIKNRKSLTTVKSHLTRERDEQRARVRRGTGLFFEKWDSQRFATMVSSKIVPGLIGKSIGALGASVFLNNSADSDDTPDEDGSKTASWKDLIIETMEELFPKILKRAMA
ncbi:MAG: hypothetical protein WEC59_01235 [Salibacteraceae bacterium]